MRLSSREGRFVSVPRFSVRPPKKVQAQYWLSLAAMHRVGPSRSSRQVRVQKPSRDGSSGRDSHTRASVTSNQASRIRKETASKSRRTENGKKLEMYCHLGESSTRKHLSGKVCAEIVSERLSLGQRSRAGTDERLGLPVPDPRAPRKKTEASLAAGPHAQGAGPA